MGWNILRCFSKGKKGGKGLKVLFGEKEGAYLEGISLIRLGEKKGRVIFKGTLL